MSLSNPNDFAEDVFEIVKNRRLKFHGCDPSYLEICMNGDLKMWFYGHRNGKAWAGGVTIQKRASIDHALLQGDSHALADAFEQCIDDIYERIK